MILLEEANKCLEEFHKIVNTGKAVDFDRKKGIKVGVDLGTSSIVFVVLDHENKPIFGAFEYADAVKDGLVVNYQKSVEVVTRLKNEAQKALNCEIKSASGAVPPGTVGNNKRVVGNVIESSFMQTDKLIDEPSAAALLLKIKDGAVIDVGGGTTGISIIKNNQIEFVDDEPTGGTHMTLVLAGHHKMPFDEAELLKRDSKEAARNFIIIRPVVEKMADICKKVLKSHPIEPLFVVGGATYFDEFAKTFADYLHQKVYKPLYPQYVTPIGIAMSSDTQML